MNVLNFINEYWYFIISSIILLFVYFRYSNNEKIANWSNTDLALFLEIGFFGLIVITVQDILFNNHWFWIISLFIFIPIWGIILIWLFSKNDYYVIESSMQGEQFHDLGLIDKKLSTSTFQKIIIMDKDYYEKLNHIGDSKSPFWKTGNRIRNTDYYDSESLTLFHPEFPELHNISFYSAKAYWLKMKKDLPKLIRQNTTLTWLMNYYIMDKIDGMKQNFVMHLSNIESQHEHKPFELNDDLDEIFKQLYAEKQKSLTQKEMEIETPETKENGDD